MHLALTSVCFVVMYLSVCIYVHLRTMDIFSVQSVLVQVFGIWNLILLSRLKFALYYLRETVRRVRELVQFGGFSDCEHLQRTLAKEFQQMETRYVGFRVLITVALMIVRRL